MGLVIFIDHSCKFIRTDVHTFLNRYFNADYHDEVCDRCEHTETCENKQKVQSIFRGEHYEKVHHLDQKELARDNHHRQLDMDRTLLDRNIRGPQRS